MANCTVMVKEKMVKKETESAKRENDRMPGKKGEKYERRELQEAR